jgi:hypothetical protein
MESTYQVWQASWNATEPRLEKLAKRAAKLGMTITWSLGAWTPAVVGYERDVDGMIAIPKVPIYANQATATLTGETPKLPGGWTLVGVIELLEGNVLLRNVPGETMPVLYRDAARATLCEHCNTKRNRTATFVVRDEAGAHKQVGRQCLADFLGHVDPHALSCWRGIAARLERLHVERGRVGRRRRRKPGAPVVGYEPRICYQRGLCSRRWLVLAQERGDLRKARHSGKRDRSLDAAQA